MPRPHGPVVPAFWLRRERVAAGPWLLPEPSASLLCVTDQQRFLENLFSLSTHKTSSWLLHKKYLSYSLLKEFPYFHSLDTSCALSYQMLQRVLQGRPVGSSTWLLGTDCGINRGTLGLSLGEGRLSSQHPQGPSVSLLCLPQCAALS